MTLKSFFPAVTAARLAAVATTVSILTPVVWSVWWYPFAKTMPAWLHGLVAPLIWETWPLAIFPMGFIAMTYCMYRAGMMKSDADPIQYDIRPTFSNREFWRGVDRGEIRKVNR